MKQRDVPVLRNVIKQGNRRIIQTRRVNTEIDFVVERIVEKHSRAMRKELKAVLSVIVDVSE